MAIVESISAQKDRRNILNGYKISGNGYCDQPYVVIADDGKWVCVMTTGVGIEGDPGQHVVSLTSVDQGRTWSEPVDIEPAEIPEASWATPLKVPGGRIYVFYTYNGDNIREVITDPGYEEVGKRVDTLGYMVFKYSDDNGKTWSKERYKVPMRNFQIDRKNAYEGKIQFFWTVAKPVIHSDGCVYLAFSKVGSIGITFLSSSEGAILKSDNILTEKDVNKIRWETLPDGEIGLRAPLGSIGEEHNLTYLSNGDLYCTYRTVEGHSCHAYSHDGGHSWTPPEYMTYTPGGRKIKNPRAANFVRRFSNGKYIYWFHNNGANWLSDLSRAYVDREIVWMSGGVEKDGYIHWSQPEIVLYEDGVTEGISYPDFVEDNGNYYITETQKNFARAHQVENRVFEDMWAQMEDSTGRVTRDGLVLEAEENALKEGTVGNLPKLPNFLNREALTLELWISFNELKPGEMILDSRDDAGRGLCLTVTGSGTVRFVLNDVRSECVWECDRNLLQPKKLHHIVIIADGGPKTIGYVIDGVLCDGGEYRQFGWGRMNRDMGDINSTGKLRTGRSASVSIKLLRIYNRYLRTSEAIFNYRAGL